MLTVRDSDTGEAVAELKGHSKPVTRFAFSPDGKRVVSASWDKSLIVWDVETTEKVLVMKGHTDRITACAYSPDGRRIVSGSGKGRIRIWDATSGDGIATLTAHKSWITACAFSPDGRRIVSSSGRSTVRFWAATTGRPINSMTAHSRSVKACVYSPDGQSVVSAAEDCTIVVWDSRAQRVVLKFFGKVFECLAIGVGGSIVAGDSTGAVYFLRLSGFEFGPPVTTLVYLYQYDLKRFDDYPSAQCGWCGRRFSPSRFDVDAIRDVSASKYHPDLPGNDASNDQRLLSGCAHCHQPLRFNPFIVDNRDRY